MGMQVAHNSRRLPKLVEGSNLMKYFVLLGIVISIVSMVSLPAYGEFIPEDSAPERTEGAGSH